MSTTLRFLAYLAALLLLLGFVQAGQSDGEVSDVAELRRARQRWAQLTPQQQDEVRANYRRYLALSEEERAELRLRAEATRMALERLQEGLPEDVRAELAELDPAKRREVLRDMHGAAANEVGRRIRSKLPEDFLARLERAEPGKRAALLRRFQEQQRGRVARGAVEVLGKSLELPEAEIRRRQNLPDDERARLLLAMRSEVQDNDAEETGLPPGLTWEQWELWSRLPPREFFARIMDFRQQRLRAPQKGTGGASDAAASDPQRPSPAGTTAEQRHVSADQPLPRVLRRLSAALRPDPRDALELIELTRPERQRAMSSRRRARCLQLMLGERLLPPARMLELEALPDEAFFDFVRQMLLHSGYLGPATDRPLAPDLDEPAAGKRRAEPQGESERAQPPADGRGDR